MYRELDDAAKLTESASSRLFDLRIGRNICHSTLALLRQSVYSRLAGYEDVNDADRLSIDPVMRQVIGGRAANKQAASASQVARFETKVLTEPGNLKALMGLSDRWVESVRERKPMKKLILDLDSSVNLTGSPKQVTHFYNQRGTAEQWIKEGKYAFRWTRLSCHSFDANQVRLQLHVLAYNLGNFLRRLALPTQIKNWSLTTLWEKLIKTGAKMVRHARYVTFQMAEVTFPHDLYRAMLRRIKAFAAMPIRAGVT